MQEITYTTENGTVTINDGGTGGINGEWCFLWLNNFDGNSQSLNVDKVECIGIPGQETLSVTEKAKTITAKIAFSPIYRNEKGLYSKGERGKHALRREILKLFPLGEKGKLTYKNDVGEWHIAVRVDETPKVGYTSLNDAEATVYFTADYPFWEYPTIESENINVSSGVGSITSTEFGDVDSPIEVIVACTSDITGGFKIYCENNTYWFGVNCLSDVEAGTVLKYDIGTKGKLACYKQSSENWIAAPLYWAFRGEERRICNKTYPTTFNISIPSGAADVKIIYHNRAISV